MSESNLPPNVSNQIRNSVHHDPRLLLLTGDCGAAAIALGNAMWLTALTAQESFAIGDLFNRPIWFYWLVPIWLVLLHSFYDSRKVAQRVPTLRNLLFVAGAALALYLGIFFLAQPLLLPRLVILYFIVLTLFLTALWRMGYIAFIATRPKRLLIVGANPAGELITQLIHDLRPQQYSVIGFIDDDPAWEGKRLGDKPLLGDQRRLIELARASQISLVVLAITGPLEGSLIQTLTDCGDYGIEVVRMSDLYEQISGRVPIYHLDADWVVMSLGQAKNDSLFGRTANRVFDLIGSLFGLLILALMYVPISLAIWLESGRPIFYKQARSGRGGQSFVLYKFRTMLPEAEPEGQPRWAEPDDERATKVGRFLRRLRIDEMPQFWNVLKGEMSLIGPRPERPEFISLLENRIPFYRARLLVKPGITGWAQVNYGYAASVDNTALKLEYDLYYIKQRSVLLDLLILWRTIITIARFQGT